MKIKVILGDYERTDPRNPFSPLTLGSENCVNLCAFSKALEDTGL